MTMRSMTSAEGAIEGVLPVDKPVGPTSHDIVARARRSLGTRRVGHTGTLDPFASGLLLLCIGRATRVAEYLTGMDKEYDAVVRLGVVTDTDDATGTPTAEHAVQGVTRAGVERALASLRGDILQTPPAYSAKKVQGERAYAIARQGREVALTPVPVTVHELTMMSFDGPEIALNVVCSSGTYIRALARDLGAALGTGAHLTALRRTAIGPHRVEAAISAEALESDRGAVGAALISTLGAIGGMPTIEVSGEDIAHIRQGRRVDRSSTVIGTVALSAGGELVAIAESDGERLAPRKVFM